MKTLYNKNILLLLTILAAFGCSSVGNFSQKNEMYSNATYTTSASESTDVVICHWFRNSNPHQQILPRELQMMIVNYAPPGLTLREKQAMFEEVKKWLEGLPYLPFYACPCLFPTYEFYDDNKFTISRFKTREALNKTKSVGLCFDGFSAYGRKHYSQQLLGKLLNEVGVKIKPEWFLIEEKQIQYKAILRKQYTKLVEEAEPRLSNCKRKFIEFRFDTLSTEKNLLRKSINEIPSVLVPIKEKINQHWDNEISSSRGYISNIWLLIAICELEIILSSIEKVSSKIILKEDNKLIEFGRRLDKISKEVKNNKCINSKLTKCLNRNHKKWHKQTTTKLERLIIMGGISGLLKLVEERIQKRKKQQKSDSRS